MRYLLLLWVSLLLVGTARGGAPVVVADTLQLQANTVGPWGHYFAYCRDSSRGPATGARGAALWAAGAFRRMPREVFQAGFTQDRVWLRATVVNTLPQRTRFVWVLYAFADSTTLFVQPDGPGPPRREIAVSGRVVAARRLLPMRTQSLPFWLEAHQRAVVYLRVDNNAGFYYLPTRLTTTEQFVNREYGNLFTSPWTLLLGLFIGSALFNLLLFAFLRDNIHLWYGAYVLFGTWFLVMEDGLDAGLLPQPAYALGWQLGQFGVLLLALASGVRIMASFLRLRQSWPRLYAWSWALSGSGAAYAVAYALLTAPALRAGGPLLAWLNAGREVLLWTLLLGGSGLLLAVWRRGRSPQRRLARLYGLTYVFFFIGTANFLVNRTFSVNIHLAEPNALAAGLTWELVTLSLVLSGRFRKTLQQNAELRLRRLRERATAGQRLIAAQDEEREALARELHDALAPGLTALHLAWQGRHVRQALAEAAPVLLETHAHTEALLRQLRNDVRSLSQVLLPTPPGEQPPLTESVGLLVETISLADGGPLVSCFCDPAAADLPAAVQQSAYRIVAELLHNALRHAQARHVRVDITRLPASVRLAVADDGRGFDPGGPPRRGGLGLQGIQARARYQRGQVQVISRPGQGTVVTVELPVA